MKEIKPLASLSAGLLARKGQAKPAMRPGHAMLTGSHDELGWNDFHGGHAPVSSDLPPVAPVPEVVRQQEEVAREFATELDVPVVLEPEAPPAFTAPQPEAPRAPVLPVSRASGLKGGKAKAAFTLRLDADRHLRLRLACAVSNRSAQQIVTEALDVLLSQRPDLDSLTHSLSAPGTTPKL